MNLHQITESKQERGYNVVIDKFDDQLSINEAILKNEIDAQWFLPFIIHRLQAYTDSRQVVIKVTFQDVLEEPIVVRQLLLTWDVDTPKFTSPPVQESVITEWAACGIACAIIPFYTELNLIKVTESGDRFDYWIGDGAQLYGLEVSGILQGSRTSRERAKVQQLLDNPFGIGGYVCIVHFGEQSIDLSFHQP